MKSPRLQIDMPASEAQYCPHLGLEDDLQTCMGYPSPWNLCNHCKPASAVLLRHQRHVCLTTAYMGCPVFQATEEIPLPKPLRDRSRFPARSASRGR